MKNELELLRAVALERINLFELSRRFSPDFILSAKKLGFLIERHDHRMLITDAGKNRLISLMDTAAAQRQRDVLADQERRQRLEEQREEHARKKAEAEEKERRYAAHNAVEKRKDRKHDYAVAAFGAVLGSLLTLVVQHADCLFNALVNVVRVLFH